MHPQAETGVGSGVDGGEVEVERLSCVPLCIGTALGQVSQCQGVLGWSITCNT